MVPLIAGLTLSQVTEPTPPPDSSRFRFGIGLASGAVIVPDTSHGLVPVAAALGLDLRLGEPIIKFADEMGPRRRTAIAFSFTATPG
jgi:hypothetical protein